MNRSQPRTHHRWFVGLVAMLAIAGCGSTDSDAQPEPTLAGLDTSSPATETEGPPPDPGGGGASVSLPSAPVGGQSEQPGDDPAFQCLGVSWLAGDDATIPDGASVALGDFSFDPAVFDVAESGCEDQGPHCSGFAFTASELSCSLPLQWNGTEFSPDVFEASANVAATATCDEESPECTEFLVAVTNQSASQLSVTLPPVDESTTEDGSETTSSG